MQVRLLFPLPKFMIWIQWVSFIIVTLYPTVFIPGFIFWNWWVFYRRCKICNRRPYPNDDYCKGHGESMTIKDAIDMWLTSHKLKVIHSTEFGGWTCRDQTKGTWMSLSNNMHLSIGEDGFIQINGSLSKKSYKVHISDPSLFPILDRALDEEDKWIRDGHRAPQDELGDTNNRKA